MDAPQACEKYALGFAPITNYEWHQRQGYGPNQGAKFKRDGFNPWLYDRDDETDLGKLAKRWPATDAANFFLREPG